MNILIGLTYYRPHYSGLTIYTERLARGLVKLGHQVTVLTSRFSSELAEQETRDGVRIIRPSVAMHLSKGVLMPSMPVWAKKLINQADIVNLHLPQMDAAYVSLMARLAGKPVVMTYHCDLKLPRGVIHWLANQGAHLSGHMTAIASNKIITNTRDYAEHSGFLRRYLHKMDFIPTPIDLPPIGELEINNFRKKFQVEPGQRIIGMNARLATEKGVEYLIEAMPAVLQKFPLARVLHVGQYQNLLGEEKYAAKLAPLIEKLGNHWSFLGILSPEEHAAFFHTSELLVLPSINSTESFGMVQIEAMICGTPVVASDLPGVRCAVRETGMGRIVPPRNSELLSKSIIDVLDHPEKYAANLDVIRQRYSTDNVALQYESLFKDLIKH